MAVTLGLYVTFTAWVATSSWVPPLVEQLEAPRLMPFQRLLMIWFAALAIGMALKWIGERWPTWYRMHGTAAVTAVAAILVMVAFVRPLPFVPDNYRGLTEVETTGNEDYALFIDAIDLAEGQRPDGTSIFVIGNKDSWWHHQLWAPVASDAPFYFDDWMWYWTTTHPGPYDYRQGHYFPNPSEALTNEYLGANGISVVVVTDMWESPQNPREAAAGNELLEFVETIGAWDIYTVREPSAIITNGSMVPDETTLGNQHLGATFEDGDGNVVIRRNWFPRWEVLANGEPVEVTKREDGYMEVSVSPGPIEIEVVYTVTAMDWIARAASVLGVAGLLAFNFLGRKLSIYRPQPTPQSGPAGTLER